MKRVVEPNRRSLLDVVQKNLRAAGRITFITRVAYIGAYTGTADALEEKMKSIISFLQKDYTHVPITGFFLVCPQYYVHVIEASEEVLYKHFKILGEDKSQNCKIGRSIFLSFDHHVHQRFFTEWFHMHAIPPSLLEKLESYELSEIQKQVTHCLTKIYTLCDTIANTVYDYSITMKDVVDSLGDKVTRHFPESTVVEYLINATHPVILTIEEYLRIYTEIPYINLYQDRIWPPPRDFIFSRGFNKSPRRSVGHESVKSRGSYYGHR